MQNGQSTVKYSLSFVPSGFASVSVGVYARFEGVGKMMDMTTLLAHFDGQVLVPEKPISLPQGRLLRIQVDDGFNGYARTPETTRTSYIQVMAQIRAGQQARGHLSRSRDEIDAELNQDRQEWDD